MTLSPTSLAQYEGKLRLLREGMKIPGDGLEFLKKPVQVIKFIENINGISFNTRKAYYIAIVSTLKTQKGFARALGIYRTWQDRYNKLQNELYEKQELTPIEKDKYLDWNDVLKVRTDAEKAITDTKSYQDYIIVCLYTYIPPARLDYGALKIVDSLPNPLTGNYFVNSQNPEIVLTEYKTARKYGKHIIKIPAELSTILKKFIRTTNAKYLLENTNKEIMSETLLNKNLTRIFTKFTDKKISVNMLRHSYVSKHMEGQPTKREADKFAKGMMHSSAMEHVYRKIE